MRSPFLKWPGGKRKLASFIGENFPVANRLIEPFVGAGSIFLSQNFKENLLSDVNATLIHCYQFLQKEEKEFVDYVKTFFIPENNTKERYLELRDRFNSGISEREKAALFIYLNRHGFNGLCRYNAKGNYNVGFGFSEKIYFPENEMMFCAWKSKNCTFKCQDFLETMDEAVVGDVVYCDPPYVDLDERKSFTSYSGNEFTEVHQHLLLKKAKELVSRGIPVLISNHDSSWVRKFYSDAVIKEILVQRTISKGKNSKEKEILAIFGE